MENSVRPMLIVTYRPKIGSAFERQPVELVRRVFGSRAEFVRKVSEAFDTLPAGRKVEGTFVYRYVHDKKTVSHVDEWTDADHMHLGVFLTQAGPPHYFELKVERNRIRFVYIPKVYIGNSAPRHVLFDQSCDGHACVDEILRKFVQLPLEEQQHGGYVFIDDGAQPVTTLIPSKGTRFRETEAGRNVFNRFREFLNSEMHRRFPK